MTTEQQKEINEILELSHEVQHRIAKFLMRQSKEYQKGTDEERAEIEEMLNSHDVKNNPDIIDTQKILKSYLYSAVIMGE